MLEVVSHHHHGSTKIAKVLPTFCRTVFSDACVESVSSRPRKLDNAEMVAKLMLHAETKASPILDMSSLVSRMVS